MLVKITSKRQVTFPASVLAALGVLRLEEGPDGLLLRPQRVDGSRRCAASSAEAAAPSISRRSGSSPMTRRFGIDASVLVRLLTGDPEAGFARCVGALTALVEEGGAEILASNQVIGEACAAVRHHHGVSRPDARAGLLDVLRSGLVAPLNGSAVLAVVEASEGAGLLDRLVADDHARAGLEVLTMDRKMAALDGARRL